MKIETCGSATSCGLVLDHVSVSDVHARIELASDGLVRLQDADSANGTFLKRNDTWIRVRRVTLCIDDRIRFGDVEVPLDRLTAVFGDHSNARLEAKHFALRHGNKVAQPFVRHADHGVALKKPRRNPRTGKIEEDRPN